MSSELFVVVRRHRPPPDQQCRREDEAESGKDSPDPAGVELREREEAFLQLLEDDSGDEKSRKHEEDIYAREASRKGGRKGVKSKDRDDCYRAQAVNVRSVCVCHVEGRLEQT